MKKENMEISVAFGKRRVSRMGEVIKSIDTEYNGYKFRSRIEARWAVFFDAVGLKYEYEKEGYDLDGVLIPDARASNFYRLIYINEICDVEVEGVEEILTGYAERCEGEGYSKIGMQIISKVGWMNKGKMRTLEAEERLYNWK